MTNCVREKHDLQGRNDFDLSQKRFFVSVGAVGNFYIKLQSCAYRHSVWRKPRELPDEEYTAFCSGRGPHDRGTALHLGGLQDPKGCGKAGC